MAKKVKNKSAEWRLAKLERDVLDYTTYKDHVSVRVEIGQAAAVAIQCHKDNLDELKQYFAKLITNLLQINMANVKTPEANPAEELRKYLTEQTEVSQDAGGTPIYQ